MDEGDKKPTSECNEAETSDSEVLPQETKDFRLEMERIKLERLKVYGKIISVFITVIFGTLLVAFINNTLKEKELQLQDKKAESERRQTEMKYLGDYLKYALEDDIFKRIRFSEYFAALTVSDDLQKKWEKYKTNLYQDFKAYEMEKSKQIAAEIAGDSKAVEEIDIQSALLKSKIERVKKPVEEIKQQQIGPLNIKEVEEGGKTRIYISNDKDEVRFTKFRKGVYYFGKQKVIDFIKTNTNRLKQLGLTNSEINVMTAVAENSGNFDSLNTWDNSFVTFGLFQWTIGAGKNTGKLPALLKKIKHNYPAVFQKYYGRHGLDIADDSFDTKEIAGYFNLNGQKLVTPADKERLRNYQWAFYFWLSGQDSLVQSVEIQQALSRIDVFYRSDSYKIKDYYIADLVTSEYGVVLILDNHVNRPGYLRPCLEKALGQSGLSNPQKWGTEEERKLIDAYLRIRETYGNSPMTDAAKRAAVTEKYLQDGTISDKRGSFRQ